MSAEKPRFAGHIITDDQAIYITKSMAKNHGLWPMIEKKKVSNTWIEKKGIFSRVVLYYTGNGPPCYAENWIVTKVGEDGYLRAQFDGIFCAVESSEWGNLKNFTE